MKINENNSTKKKKEGFAAYMSNSIAEIDRNKFLIKILLYTRTHLKTTNTKISNRIIKISNYLKSPF